MDSSDHESQLWPYPLESVIPWFPLGQWVDTSSVNFQDKPEEDDQAGPESGLEVT